MPSLATLTALTALAFLAVVAVGDAPGDVRHGSLQINLPSAQIGSKKQAIDNPLLLWAYESAAAENSIDLVLLRR